MCDYSMHAIKNRKAVVGDKIKTSIFNGHSSPGIESCAPGEAMMAICLIPGTGIEFDRPVTYRKNGYAMMVSDYRTAKYVHIPNASYSDHLKFPDGSLILIAYLAPGQTGTVAYVPEEVVKQVDEPVLTTTLATTRRRRVAELFGIS
jgi:hypothetical protein